MTAPLTAEERARFRAIAEAWAGDQSVEDARGMHVSRNVACGTAASGIVLRLLDALDQAEAENTTLRETVAEQADVVDELLASKPCISQHEADDFTDVVAHARATLAKLGAR